MKWKSKNKAVFLDRDGIINKEKNFVKSWEEFEFVPGIIENIKKLKEAGFLVIVVTNQSGIKRGLYAEETLKQIHENMKKIFKENGTDIDDIFYCPHYEDDNCNCRKPKPGMILEATEKHNIDLKQSWVIGDEKRDIEAGKRAGCNTVLVKKNSNIRKEIDKIIISRKNKKNILICGLPTTVIRIFVENLKDDYNIFFISYSKKLQYSRIKEIIEEKAFLIDVESFKLLGKLRTLLKLLSTSFKIASNRRIQILIAYHNQPIRNGMVLLLMKWFFPKIKRIYFPYDIMSYAFPKELRYRYTMNSKVSSGLSFFFDRYCFENCDKIITKGFENELIYLKGIYKIHRKPHLAFNFLIERKDVVNKAVKKFDSNKVNLLFIGGIYDDRNACVHNYEVFRELLEEKRIMVHVYSGSSDVLNSLKHNKNLIIHDYITEHDKLIKEISRFDFAINWFKEAEDSFIHAKMASAVKMYDYLAAGLPIIIDNEHENMAKMVADNNFGIVIPGKEVRNIMKYIENCDYNSLITSVKKNREKYYVENNVSKLINFIEDNVDKKIESEVE